VKLSFALMYGLIASLCFDAVRNRQLSYLAGGVLFVSAVGGLGTTTLASLNTGLREKSVASVRGQPVAELIRKEANNRYIMVLSTSAKLLSAAMLADAKWGSRFIAFHELPFVADNLGKLASLSSSKADRVRRLDQFLKSSVAEDIERYRPEFVFVEVGPGQMGLCADRI